MRKKAAEYIPVIRAEVSVLKVFYFTKKRTLNKYCDINTMREYLGGGNIFNMYNRHSPKYF